MQISWRFTASDRPINLGHAAAGWISVVPRQVVSDKVPRRLGSGEDVRGGAVWRIVVEAAGGNYRSSPFQDLGQDGAAAGVKSAGEAGRGFVLPDHLVTRQQAIIVQIGREIGGERRRR